MVSEDLFSIDNVMFAFVGITGKRATGNGQFQSNVHLNRGIDYSVKAKNLLLSIGVLRVSSNAYSGLHISWEFRASKEEGIGTGIVFEYDLGEDASFGNDIEACLFEIFFEAEDLVQYAWVFRICLLKGKSQYFYFWP